MINLLPPRYAQQIRRGRLNDFLRKWFIGSALASVGLLIILALGWLYINHQSNNLTANITSINGQLQAQNLPKVQKDAETISADIKIINQVLAKEIRFSDLIQEIGKIMPPGTVLGGLTLSKANGTIDLTASARDYTSAARVAVNLSDPKNNLFDRADILNITCATDSSAYKCTVSLKALFNKTAQIRFLTIPARSKP